MSPAGATLASISLTQAVVFGALSGMAGGLVGGAITGGLNGMLMGALFGFLGGAFTAGLGHGIAGITDKVVRGVVSGIMMGAGAGLSYAQGGWQGLVSFGVGLMGAMAGSKLVGPIKSGLAKMREGPSGGSSHETLLESLSADQVGGDTLNYDGKNLSYYDDDGKMITQTTATSGRNGISDARILNQGPIPEGSYTLDTRQISEGGFMRSLTGDWGSYRAPLSPTSSTNTFGRSGFFLHGGSIAGSAGCIDIGSFDSILFPMLQKKEGYINVIVDY